MFIHLGEDIAVPLKDVVSIMNIKTSGFSKKTKEFLKIAEDEGFLVRISDKKPKSFIFTIKENQTIIYLSPISSVTLNKRANFLDINNL
ncbi:MAG: DUF370 domain-containing protein [Clostridiales bacterium]|nr:DUF370 domain-containing protein [Clostridiales bacterium]